MSFSNLFYTEKTHLIVWQVPRIVLLRFGAILFFPRCVWAFIASSYKRGSKLVFNIHSVTILESALVIPCSPSLGEGKGFIWKKMVEVKGPNKQYLARNYTRRRATLKRGFYYSIENVIYEIILRSTRYWRNQVKQLGSNKGFGNYV